MKKFNKELYIELAPQDIEAINLPRNAIHTWVYAEEKEDLKGPYLFIVKYVRADLYDELKKRMSNYKENLDIERHGANRVIRDQSKAIKAIKSENEELKKRIKELEKPVLIYGEPLKKRNS